MWTPQQRGGLARALSDGCGSLDGSCCLWWCSGCQGPPRTPSPGWHPLTIVRRLCGVQGVALPSGAVVTWADSGSQGRGFVCPQVMTRTEKEGRHRCSRPQRRGTYTPANEQTHGLPATPHPLTKTTTQARAPTHAAYTCTPTTRMGTMPLHRRTSTRPANNPHGNPHDEPAEEPPVYAALHRLSRDNPRRWTPAC